MRPVTLAFAGKLLVVPSCLLTLAACGDPEMPVDDFREHTFAQVHFGFGYSGLLIHDDDALVYGVLHYVLMDEKPCDLLYRKFRIVCFES